MKCEPGDSNASGRIVCKIEEKRSVTRSSSDLQFTIKRRKMHAARDYSPSGGASASLISEIGTEVGPNVKSRGHTDAANLQVIKSSTPLSTEFGPVKSLATSSRAHEIKSKKIAYPADFNVSSTIKRQKMHEARAYSQRRGASTALISEIGTEVGPNVKSRGHLHSANLKVIRSSTSLRSELKPVKPLATSSRVHESKSKKTAYRANCWRPKVYSKRDFPAHCGDLASDISRIGAEESTDRSYTICSAVAIPRKPLRGLDAETVESLNSWSRGHEYVKKKSANHEMPLEVIWKKEKGMASMSGHPTHSESRYVQSANKEVSVSIVPYDLNQTARDKVNAVLKEFEKLSTELQKAASKREGKGLQRVDVQAAECLKRQGKWIWSEKKLGDIQGVVVGDCFQFRAELFLIGLHCQYVSGIDYISLNGRNYATSIVDSGHYENKDKSVDVLIYTGQGGNPLFGNCQSDQELKRGNLALENSMREGYPVRVIRKSKSPRASILSHMKGGRVPVSTYVYCGLYTVESYGQEREGGRLVFKFELHRIIGQPVLPVQNVKGSKKLIVGREKCIVEDLSQGKEKNPIRVMNGIDEGKPQAFTYITNITYPDWCQHSKDPGCNCIEGCSNASQCLCVRKSGNDISVSEKSIIVGQKNIVYKCGPSCKCPPPCMTRASQLGPRHKLELFRTKLQRWGVRSRDFISSGSFVCEYIGNLLQIKNARPRSEIEQVEFMYAGSENQFIVDPSKFGNVARFITHSNSPNLVARYILFDHEDERMPHIMLFAAKNIPPNQEFTCNYNQC